MIFIYKEFTMRPRDRKKQLIEENSKRLLNEDRLARQKYYDRLRAMADGHVTGTNADLILLAKAILTVNDDLSSSTWKE